MQARDRRAVALLAALLSQGVTVLPVVAQPSLKVGAIPDQNPERLNRLYGQLADELSDRLNVKVRYVPVSNYPAAVSAFRTGGLDLVWFGGLTGVQRACRHQGHRFWLSATSMPAFAASSLPILALVFNPSARSTG